MNHVWDFLFPVTSYADFCEFASCRLAITAWLKLSVDVGLFHRKGGLFHCKGGPFYFREGFGRYGLDCFITRVRDGSYWLDY